MSVPKFLVGLWIFLVSLEALFTLGINRDLINIIGLIAGALYLVESLGLVSISVSLPLRRSKPE